MCCLPDTGVEVVAGGAVARGDDDCEQEADRHYDHVDQQDVAGDLLGHIGPENKDVSQVS